MFNRIWQTGMLCAATVAALPASVSAKDTMTVTTQIQQSCTISVLPMTFGNVSFLLPSATASTPVEILCTPGTRFAVAMDNGTNFNGQRRMARAGGGFAGYLNYEIYRDAARTQRWGSTSAQIVTGDAPANGDPVTLYAYGRTSGWFAAASAYQDTITVTIAF